MKVKGEDIASCKPHADKQPDGRDKNFGGVEKSDLPPGVILHPVGAADAPEGVPGRSSRRGSKWGPHKLAACHDGQPAFQAEGGNGSPNGRGLLHLIENSSLLMEGPDL